jgi:hypothetical protein
MSELGRAGGRGGGARQELRAGYRLMGAWPAS